MNRSYVESEDSNRIEFEDLPFELQLLVFSYLTHYELTVAARVSNSFRRLAYDPSLWKRVQVDSSDCDAASFGALLDRAPLLEDLTMRASPHVLELAARSFAVRRLRLLDVGFSVGVNCAAVSALVDACTELSHLNVEGCKAMDDAAVTALCRLPYFLSLNISHCGLVTDEGIIALARGCPHLRFLNADGIPRITDRAVCELGQHLGHQLISLELDGEELTDASIEALHTCKQLRTLGISYAENLSDASLACIQGLHELRQLKLRRGPRLTARGLGRMFENKNLVNLIRLELDSLALDDEALTLLVQGCPQLHTLELPWCWDITENGLASIVAHCQNLVNLVLLGLFKIHGFCLAELPTRMPRLRCIHLEQCNEVVDLLLESLARRLPHLKVFNYYGEVVVPFEQSSSPGSSPRAERHLSAPLEQSLS
uniref:F-box domain-containing protein n=1 Tax=Rhipicephalus pulchellus TaxID=72859 RepID=L7LZT6_RHIPC